MDKSPQDNNRERVTGRKGENKHKKADVKTLTKRSLSGLPESLAQPGHHNKRHKELNTEPQTASVRCFLHFSAPPSVHSCSPPPSVSSACPGASWSGRKTQHTGTRF